jgi:hypothetical protein
VTPPLERIAGQGHTSQPLVRVERLPVDAVTALPELTDGFEQRALATRARACIRQARDRGGVASLRMAFDDPAERLPGPELDEGARRTFAEQAGEARREADRLAQLLTPVARRHGQRRLDQRATHAGDERQARRAERAACHLAHERLHDGIHGR